MKIIGIIIFMLLLIVSSSWGIVDTLADTSDIDDCIIYSYEGCTSEEQGEDCRRYNGGKVINFGIGTVGIAAERRALFRFPGWDEILPDSAQFELYCSAESDLVDRLIFAYPLVNDFIEGSESQYGVGNYPDPDSGATWNHIYLDVADEDSSSWSTPGGDYTTAIACSTIVSGTGQYFSFDNFERILSFWDSTSNPHAIILINANGFPSKSSSKTLRSSEAAISQRPNLILYFASESTLSVRRSRTILRSIQQ